MRLSGLPAIGPFLDAFCRDALMIVSANHLKAGTLGGAGSIRQYVMETSKPTSGGLVATGEKSDHVLVGE